MKRGKTKRRGPKANPNGLSNLFKLAAYGAVGLGAGNAWAETVMTFEGFLLDNLDIALIPEYGDFVSADSADYTVRAGRTGVVGTPDILLNWVGIGWDTYTAWDGRGSVAQTDFNAGPNLSILFRPSPLSAVRLVSFDLDEWLGGGPGSIIWSVDGTLSGQLASGVWSGSDAGLRSGLFPDVTGRLGEDVTLSLTHNGGAPSYLALDNLTFDQVPEPSTLALGALGAVALGAAAMRRARRAKS